jgi:sortase A
VILPETELIALEETPTATAEPAQAEEQATLNPTPTATATPTPPPTPTPDPQSLIPGRIVVPAIELDAPVVSVGWETHEVNGQAVSSWIVPNSFAAGFHSTSALPGTAGNTVLNGHHNIYGEVFRDLEDLQPGDEVVIYTGEKPQHYRVTERHILEEKYQPTEVRRQNAQFIMPTEDERLTMVTCWPYTNNTHRLIIVALPFERTPTPTPNVE